MILQINEEKNNEQLIDEFENSNFTVSMKEILNDNLNISNNKTSNIYQEN
jgi:hypothetical protein